MEPAKKSVRFGCFLPIPATPVEKLLKIAKANEDAGFDSIWAPDHLLFIPPGIVPEAWSTLTAIATITQKAVLGTCVSDPHRYHPAVLAQKVATVDRISGGRVILGIGAGEAMNLEPFGIKWKNPVSKLIEAVTIMRRLWSGEIVTFDGNFWKLKEAFLQINPVKGTVPIYFGANSPRTLKLTGELADGWLSIPLSPRLCRERLKYIKESAEKAGRSIDEIDTGVYLYTAVAKKAEQAYKRLEEMKFQIILSPEILKEAGYSIELPEELQSLSYFKAFPDDEWIEKFLKFGELIPKEAAIEFSIVGSPDNCIEKISEYVKAGIKHLLLINVGPDPRQVLELYAKEIIPHFK
jgi:alkanesulfonate monooxygenase SsuD/methylene tetrahydromethanopterin reductase-like flavin-dependent oxidoreductase (luciferase family)